MHFSKIGTLASGLGEFKTSKQAEKEAKKSWKLEKSTEGAFWLLKADILQDFITFSLDYVWKISGNSKDMFCKVWILDAESPA